MTNQQQSSNNKRIAKELTALFLTGSFGYVMGLQVATLIALLVPTPSPYAVHWLAFKVGAQSNLPGPLGVPDGPAQAIERTQSAAWLALYTVAAAGRLAELVDGGVPEIEAAVSTEGRYHDLTLQAEERRMRAAALQDMAALLNVDRSGETKGLLGWRAVLDNRTTPECRWAHGRNFKAARMPEIGWPGAVHIHCRCSPGPAIPGAPLIPSA